MYVWFEVKEEPGLRALSLDCLGSKVALVFFWGLGSGFGTLRKTFAVANLFTGGFDMLFFRDPGRLDVGCVGERFRASGGIE